MPFQNAIRYRWTEGADCFVFPPVSRGEATRGKHPVLCFLHGVGEAVNGGSPEGVGEHQSPAWHADNRSPLTAPFLTVCPQRLDPGRWTSIDARNLHLILDKVVEEQNGSDERIFLTGFSYGGDAVFWFAAYDGGRRFRKLWAVDPGLSPRSSRLSPHSSIPTPVLSAEQAVLVHYGADADQEMTKFIQRGGLIEWPEEGVPVGGRFFCDLRLEHVETCRAAYGDRRAYDWLLQE